MEKILVAGHRGSCANFPENTIPSFRAAIEAGADMIETDVHMSLDREIILIHDDHVSRTSDGTGLIREMTVDDIKKLDAGSYKDIRFAGTKVPTFCEFLEDVRDNKELLFNIELKDYYTNCGMDFCNESTDRTIDIIRSYNLESRCVITSFSSYNLEYVDKKYNHTFKLQGFYPYSIFGAWKINPDDYLYSVCIYDKESICPRKEWFDYLISHGIQPWLGDGVVLKEDFEKAVQYGGKLFTSNHPRKAKQILEELGVRCKS